MSLCKSHSMTSEMVSPHLPFLRRKVCIFLVELYRRVCVLA